MFVRGCEVDKTETLQHVPSAGSRAKKANSKNKSKTKQTQPKEEEEGESFNPIRCSFCKITLGVYDKDEVYHFFNVIASDL